MLFATRPSPLNTRQMQVGHRVAVTVACAAAAAMVYCVSWILVGVLHDLLRPVHPHQVVPTAVVGIFGLPLGALAGVAAGIAGSSGPVRDDGVIARWLGGLWAVGTSALMVKLLL
ncbi:MAG: hypothetical protein WKG00_17420 [Polyangiaceae bacterium]